LRGQFRDPETFSKVFKTAQRLCVRELGNAAPPVIWADVVRAGGFEPPRCFHQQDLNLPRMPFRHARVAVPDRRIPVRA
jgi:hypothetical protein